MPHPLQPHIPVADAIAAVFAPHVEVVIHDLATGTVHHIANPISRRSPGDESLTELESAADPDASVIGPYAKTNWDGRRLKSITAVLRDGRGRAIGLLCLNVDVSLFETLQAVARDFLRFAEVADKPSVLFRNDWREDVNDIVGRLAAERGARLSALAPDDRMALVAALDARGLFDVRNATPYIAQLLDLSRATLYKTLKDVRDRRNVAGAAASLPSPARRGRARRRS